MDGATIKKTNLLLLYIVTR